MTALLTPQARRIVALIALLLAFGLAKLPFERDLAREHRCAFFHGAQLDLHLREQIGQGAFIAALSGFRAVVADFLWVQTETAWERTEWGRMVVLYNSMTTLQPRMTLFWEEAAWQMAWNASRNARENPAQPREALRIRAERQYIALGRDYLERGIRNNPDRFILCDRLGMLLKDKVGDHAAAAAAYDKAAEFKDAYPYEKRFAAYEISYCEGRESEAYKRLRQLYDRGSKERLPTLLRRLRAMEQKLSIPEDQRVYIPREALQ